MSDKLFKRVIDTAKNCVRDIYPSTSAIRADFESDDELRTHLRYLMGSGNTVWIESGLNWEGAIQAATMGIPDNVEAIKAQRRKAEAMDVQVQFPSWSPDIAGAFADVPSFVAGEPASMRRLVNQTSDFRPIKIFVGMASSGFFGAEGLAKRGALVSALALQLMRTRRVEIYAGDAGRETNLGLDWMGMVRLPLPSSMSDLSYWICNQASVRGLLYAFERRNTDAITWPMRSVHGERGLENTADLFGAGPSDIVVPFPYGTDPMQLDPERWMRETLKRVNAI